jgi:hypothetical protein
VVLFPEKTLLLVEVDVHGRASDHQSDHHHHNRDQRNRYHWTTLMIASRLERQATPKIAIAPIRPFPAYLFICISSMFDEEIRGATHSTLILPLSRIKNSL